jgi:signal transduction histidine kinase/CheY-like chemotaxis protein
MVETRRSLGFQAKVLIPVVSVLVLFLVIIVWIVNQRLTAQLEEEARHTLITAEAVFQNSFEIHSRNLLLRYQNVVNEPRFKAVAQLAEEKTMTVQLKELLDEIGPEADAMIFTLDTIHFFAGAKREARLDLQEFKSYSSSAIRRAEDGMPCADTFALRNHLFEVISVPVIVNDSLAGVLTIGVKVGATTAQELKSLTRSEIAFIGNRKVLASTFSDTKFYPQFVSMFENLIQPFDQSKPPPETELITPNGEHFLCLAGRFNTSTGNIGYLLLSSYEKALSEKKATQRMLTLLGLIGILFSSLLIWALIQKITRPLRQLRDSAEAVGQGDFSRRVEVQSQDEYGELATVFNNMVENLKASRAEVEETLQTLKNTQAQLIQTEKLSAIGELVAGVAHELNNPLTGVIGFSEMLRESNLGERQRTFVDRIIGSAQRCHKIVQNLLSFSRRHTPERKPTDINELLEASIEIIRYEFRTSSIEIITKFANQIPSVMVDADQIQQVFLNIMSNARHAIEGGQKVGAICVSTELVEEKVLISFQDNGVGIPEEDLKNIFNPFFTTKSVGEGTGLGLSVSYGIIREHGGNITVQSRTGEGSTFTIQLPGTRSSAHLQQDKDASDSRAGGDPQFSNRKRILAIDDEESILELIKEALIVRGYQVDTASDGETALRLAVNDTYDLILCDWKIPGMGGQQIYERLRQVDPGNAERFIFMTGDVLNQKAEQFLRREGAVCLFKPFSIQEFRTRVQKFLS